MSAPRTYLQTSEQWAKFLSDFTHELRTPVASLRMLADLLAAAPQERLAEPEKRYADNIQEVVRGIQLLVSEVSDLGRLLSGRTQLRIEEVALKQMMARVEEVVRPRAWEQGIVLTDSLDPLLPNTFRTDPDRLRQALTLVLGVTVGHARSEAHFRLNAHDGLLRCTLSSDGLPFSEAALAALFEPYEDGAWNDRRRGGRSLALPLSGELVRSLGGTLQAGNHGDRPSFELLLPATPSGEPAKAGGSLSLSRL